MFDHIALLSKAQSKVSLWYWLMEEGLEVFAHISRHQAETAGKPGLFAIIFQNVLSSIQA